jgi:acyl carrier protein
MDILEKMQGIFRDLFDQPELILTEDTTAHDVEGWDSLTHVQVVVAIEKLFRIKFTAAEIRGFKNIGGMCEAIRKKTPRT